MDNNNKTSQNKMVLDYMRQHGSISPREALSFGCYRLSARISNLREDGYRIITTTDESINLTTGRVSRYARYKLIEEHI